MPPAIESKRVREALLALEGSIIEDFKLPLPGNLKDIAKAGALVSGVIEDRIPELLNRVRDRTWDEDGGLQPYEFRRSTIGFPDIELVDRANPSSVLFEIEAKSWYILSGDLITARFLTAANAMHEGTVVAIVAWMLDGVVSGSPKLLRIYSDDAHRLAAVRDEKWEQIEPAGSHRVVQPENTPGTPRSLTRIQTRGEIYQGGEWKKDADNFGKLDRLYDEQLTTFQKEVLALQAAGKTLSQWRAFIK